MGPLKKSLRSGPKGPLGPLGPLKSRFAPGPRGPLGPFKKSPRSGIHVRSHPKWSAIPFTSCPEPPRMGGEAAHLCFSGHEINGVADHSGDSGHGSWSEVTFSSGPKAPGARSEATFLRGPKAPWPPWAWSEAIFYYKGPKGPLVPLGLERSDFLMSPKAPWAPWAWSEAIF